MVVSKRYDWYYDEWSVSTGLLLSIAQYDDSLLDKNGYCIEYEDGECIGEWIYENGKRGRRVREYRNGVITLYNSSGEEKNVTEWDLSLLDLPRTIDYDNMHFLDDSSLFVSDIATGRVHGISQLNRKYSSVDWSNGDYHVVIVDLDSKEMILYTSDEWTVARHTKDVIDLDVSGRRWEGSVKDGKPFGFGVLYDEEGRKEYEGFMLDGFKAGFGRRFFNVINRLEYDGCFCYDQRFGKGTLYNRNGIIEYSGLWKNDDPYSPQFDDRTVDNHTESINIPNSSFNEVESFILPSFLHSLKHILIGNDCFGKVRLVELNGLNKLESVEIGMESVTITKSVNFRKTGERKDGLFRIVNCPKLNSIQIGDWSFCDYHSFEFKSLPSLQSIQMGVRCFYWAPSFSLTGLID